MNRKRRNYFFYSDYVLLLQYRKGRKHNTATPNATHEVMQQIALSGSYFFMTQCFTLPDLYAGKMHAMDVVDFISDLHELDIWSIDYFLQLADRIKFV